MLDNALVFAQSGNRLRHSITALPAMTLGKAGWRVKPGFHAVGRTAAGILNYPYYVSGLSLGEGTMFGRVAGQLVASSKPA